MHLVPRLLDGARTMFTGPATHPAPTGRNHGHLGRRLATGMAIPEKHLQATMASRLALSLDHRINKIGLNGRGIRLHSLTPRTETD